MRLRELSWPCTSGHVMSGLPVGRPRDAAEACRQPRLRQPVGGLPGYNDKNKLTKICVCTYIIRVYIYIYVRIVSFTALYEDGKLGSQMWPSKPTRVVSQWHGAVPWLFGSLAHSKIVIHLSVRCTGDTYDVHQKQTPIMSRPYAAICRLILPKMYPGRKKDSKSTSPVQTHLFSREPASAGAAWGLALVR